MNAGEIKTVKTAKFGNVVFENHNDETLFVTWYKNGKYQEKGWLVPATGEVRNVPKELLQEVAATL